MKGHLWEEPAARRVLDQMDDRFIAIDRNDTLLFVNRSLLVGTGRTPDQMIGRNYWEFWPDLKDTLVEQSYAKVRARGEALRFQYLHPRGAWLDIDVFPEADQLHIYFRNLTRHLERAEWAEREALLRPLIDAIPHIAWSADLQNVPTYLNERYWQYTGLSPESPFDAGKVVHPEDIEGYREASGNAMAQAMPYGYEVRLRRADGRYLWHEVRIEPRFDEQGALAGWVGTSTDVHDRRESEKRLSQLVEGLGDALYTVDRDWRIVHFNAGAEAMFGVSREHVVGCVVWETFPRSASTELEHRYREVMESGAAQSFEAFSPTLGRWLFARAQRYADGISVVLQDVTDRKKSEEAVLEAQEHMRYALSAANAGTWHIDTAGRKVDWSHECSELYGIPVSSPPPTFEAWLALVLDEDRPNVVEKVGAALFGRTDFRVEYRIHHATKGERWLASAGGVLSHRPGHLAGITYDITDARRQLALLQATVKIGRTLSSEHHRGKIVQSLIDASTEAIGAEFGAFFPKLVHEAETPLDGVVVTGLSAEESSDLAKVRNTPLFSRTLAGHGTTRLDDAQGGVWANGEPIPPHLLSARSYLAVPVRSSSGPILGGLFFGHSTPGRFTDENAELIEAFASQAAVAYDNSLLYEQIRQANDDLEARVAERTSELIAANEALQGFTYHVSHDLRTPLRAIVGYSRLIEEDYGSRVPEEALGLLRRQSVAARKLGTLIDDLLSLSRLSREEIVKRSLNLTAILRDVADEALSEHPGTKVHVVVADGLQAKADPRLLRLALHNLVENAIKYSPDGGTVTIGEIDGTFTVQDQGIGFDPQYAEKIFEPFQRLHRDVDFKGTGIGLANVKQVIDRHGGRIWAEGRPGSGSTFFFRLD